VYMTSPAQMTSSMMVQEPVVTTMAMQAPPATMTVMEQQAVPTRMEAMPVATYGAPSATYIAGAQPGVMVGGTTVVSGAVQQQEGFLQHAMHTVGNALGLGGGQATTTYVQGGGVTVASAPAGGVTSFGSVQAAAPVTTMSTGSYAVGGAGSAGLFDQIDTNKDGVISRAEFAQAVQQ